jgi:YHS domain-containing protein
MKRLHSLLAGALVMSAAFATLTALADDKPATKPKPYTLKTCVVSGEKLGEMGDPYVYVHEGREIKFCCKNCVKDFKKDPAKYIKKIEEAEAKEKQKKKS